MKRYIFSVFIVFAILLGFVAVKPSKVEAFDPFGGSACTQTQTTKDADGNEVKLKSPVCAPSNQNNPISGPTGVINKIANIFAMVTGVAAVVVIIISGFEYVRSTGDSAKINKAKNGILYALIGLVVVALARALVALAVSKL